MSFNTYIWISTIRLFHRIKIVEYIHKLYKYNYNIYIYIYFFKKNNKTGHIGL